MLVIRNVYKRFYLHDEVTINLVPYISIDYNSLMKYFKLRKDDMAWVANISEFTELAGIYLDLYDTSTNKILEYISLFDIEDKLNNIFGIIRVLDELMFIALSDKDWDFLSICDVVKIEKYNDLPKEVRLKGVSSDNNGYVYVYVENENTTTITINCNPLDDSFVFWKSNSLKYTFGTILSLYLSIFNILHSCINEKSNIYIFSNTSKFYKLSINKEIIRFITKMRTLKC